MKRYSYGIFALFIFTSLAMFSCNSGKKFNYNSAYKFNVPAPYAYGKSRNPALVEKNNLAADSTLTRPDEILVSTERKIVLPKRTIKTIDPVKSINLDKPVVKNTPAVSPELSTLSVKEIRKEIRTGFKKYRKEIKEKQKVGDRQETQDGFGRGLVLVILGLVLIVVGIALVHGIGALLGILIAAVGLIMFLLGFLKMVL